MNLAVDGQDLYQEKFVVVSYMRLFDKRKKSGKGHMFGPKENIWHARIFF